MSSNDNISERNSQNIEILNNKNPDIEEKNKKNEKSSNAYPAFKNRLKALFNEFANEEGNSLQPSVPVINFSEKILELPSGWCRLLICLVIILICLVFIVVFTVLGKDFLFIIPVPGLGIIVTIILTCNFMTISPGEVLS